MWLVLLLACHPCDDGPMTAEELNEHARCFVEPMKIDQDGDGADFQVDDCDDDDPDRFPGNREVPYDGVDQDCDDLHKDLLDVDGDSYPGVDPATYIAAYDQDGDGFRDGDEATKTPVWPEDVRKEQDCDDEDWSIYPGAPDTWDDGIDQDCDGQDDTADTGETGG